MDIWSNLNSNLTSELLQSQKFWDTKKELSRPTVRMATVIPALVFTFTTEMMAGWSRPTMTAHLGLELLSGLRWSLPAWSWQGLWFLLPAEYGQSEVLSLPWLGYKDGDFHCVSNLSFLLALLKQAATGKGPSMWPWTECSHGPAAQGELSPENHHTNAASEVDANHVKMPVALADKERLPPLKGPEPELKPGFLVHRDDDTTKCIILSY